MLVKLVPLEVSNRGIVIRERQSLNIPEKSVPTEVTKRGIVAIEKQP